jgi:hypothetical protein
MGPICEHAVAMLLSFEGLVCKRQILAFERRFLIECLQSQCS